MKKLIVCAILVAVTTMANAAALTWNASNIKLASSSDVATSYVAFLCDATETSMSDMIASLDSGNVSLFTTTPNDTVLASTALSGTTTGRTGAKTINDFKTTSNQSPAVDDTFTMYLVLFNSDKTQYSIIGDVANGGLTKPLSQDGKIAMAFGNQNLANTWSAVGGDVPEPTSGLLLLVGSALLALRRKQK